MRTFKIRVDGDSVAELEEKAIAAARPVFLPGTVLEVDETYTISPMPPNNDGGAYIATIRIRERDEG